MFDLFGNLGIAAQLPPDLAESRPVKVLEESLRNGRLAHAILFHGENFDHLALVAEALAGVLLEASGKVTGHPDFFTLRPAKRARQIRITGDAGKSEPNTMRWFLHDLHQSSNRGGAKVGVIYEADRMNATVANAFLKTLEEPPPETTLLLLTTRPYDLLTTIRSRCFNFRLPGESSSLGIEEWDRWLEDYALWLHLLHRLKNEPAARAEAVFGVYGLVARFSDTLSGAGDRVWKQESAKLPDHLSEEEQEALKAGVTKGLRMRLWADIEKATRDFARSLEKQTPGTLPARHLARAISRLEHCCTLNSVFNLKEETALEAFLLASLRIWPVR
jgi:DNA polymerase III subunit delta'